jgi:hypothetical protein
MSAERTEFSVSWPVQGVACFRSEKSELVLSDVYWLWIFEALSVVRDDGWPLPFIEAAHNGFNDPSNLVEALPVTPRFLELLRQVTPSSAPSFERLVPSPGSSVPTPEQILAELTRVAGEALSSGSMKMEVE